MSAEPEALGESAAWLASASQDLQVAERSLAAPPLLGAVAFHAQQAAEKALKAYLAAHGRPLPKTHELATLTSLCLALDPAFETLHEVRRLNPYAVTGRYPDMGIEPTFGDAQDLLAIAGRVVAFVRSRIEAR